MEQCENFAFKKLANHRKQKFFQTPLCFWVLKDFFSCAASEFLGVFSICSYGLILPRNCEINFELM
jgi:hypothetical protein